MNSILACVNQRALWAISGKIFSLSCNAVTLCPNIVSDVATGLSDRDAWFIEFLVVPVWSHPLLT